MIDFKNKDTMTPKERLKKLIAGEKIDRVPFNPFSAGFSARVCGMDRGDFYRHPEQAFRAGMGFMKRYPWMNARPSYGWADRGAWEFGGSLVWPDHDAYPTPVSPDAVILEPEEVESLPDPDPQSAGIIPLLDRFNELSRKNGFPAALPGGTPTTSSAGIVGRGNFLKWIIKYPEAVHRLQQKVNRFLMRCAEITIHKFGGENCALFCAVPMESNQLIAPKTFETFCLPYIRELMEYYTSRGVRNVLVHLCGDHRQNLPLWSSIPVPERTTFSVGHEMDLLETGGEIGKTHILAGNIDSTLLQTGSTKAVAKAVTRCLEAGMKHPGGFFLMPACELPPDTPLTNVGALARTLYEKGYYE